MQNAICEGLFECFLLKKDKNYEKNYEKWFEILSVL